MTFNNLGPPGPTGTGPPGLPGKFAFKEWKYLQFKTFYGSLLRLKHISTLDIIY